MQRREFIKNCTATCIGMAGISFLQSCGGIHYATSTVAANKVTVNKTEFIDKKQIARDFVVIRSEKLQFPIALYKKGDKYSAVYMQCSHQGCEVNANKNSLVCPCHGSEFSTEGKVLNPPADKDLKLFKVSSDNENVYVEI